MLASVWGGSQGRIAIKDWEVKEEWQEEGWEVKEEWQEHVWEVKDEWKEEACEVKDANAGHSLQTNRKAAKFLRN